MFASRKVSLRRQRQQLICPLIWFTLHVYLQGSNALFSRVLPFYGMTGKSNNNYVQ